MKTLGWLEFETLDAVSEYQGILLKKAVEYAFKYSKFYNKLFKDNGINLSDIKTIDDIKKIPITSKYDLQNSNEDFFCCKLNEASDVVHTSGSSGVKPIINILTRSDLDRLAYGEELNFLCSEVKKNDIFMNTVAMDGFYIAGMAYYMGLRRLGACVLRVGAKELEQQFNALLSNNITGIVGVPSNLITLAEYCVENNACSIVSTVKKLILIGETIRDRDYNLNSLGQKLSNAWPNAKIISTYGNTELAAAFCECTQYKGTHVHPDLCYVEILDNNGNRLEPGKIGDLIVTTFGTQGMPLLRYRTGDITFIDSQNCACGRTAVRVAPILGRRENMLKVKGVSVYPSVIEDVILKMEQIKDYVILIKKAENGTDGIEILVSFIKNDNLCDTITIIEGVRKEARITPIVTVCEYEKIKSMHYMTESRKARRVIDLRKN